MNNNHTRQFKLWLNVFYVLWGIAIFAMLYFSTNLGDIPSNPADIVEYFMGIIVAAAMVFCYLPFIILTKFEVDRLNKLK